MGARKYLGECPDGRVDCPIWQCSGHLYLLFPKHMDGPDRDDGWQIPNIVCDDCGTIFENGLRKK